MNWIGINLVGTGTISLDMEFQVMDFFNGNSIMDLWDKSFINLCVPLGLYPLNSIAVDWYNPIETQ